jgi:hypothetical protein
MFWFGYKLHVTETCDDPPACGCPDAGQPGAPRGGHYAGCAAPAFPNLITDVQTTPADVRDSQVTAVINDALAGRGLAPARMYADSGYLTAALVAAEARRHGITLTGPLLADNSAQARARAGYAGADFTADYDQQKVTCPQGHASINWYQTTNRGKPCIIVQFSPGHCGPCPARALCTRSKRRQLTLPPRDLAEIQAAARAAQDTISFQADYARRAGVEGTMAQAASHGARRARYRGLPKTRLDHIYMAVALNLLRLHAYWTATPLDRQRTSHLARLELWLAA